ncbi:hypothetical protein O9H85_16845 [Paenibacillus filicis]|uniref:General stress protein n=1 Tax=Paenibacillus gyeongsangnamensis TaxID=3388067 RepID=A0ABT4QB09_9BACL|nr:hypothetical protein [Paenibacillus filicis]MCZ8514061.1 hypothetical protein [Paenibacillus filicis]
MEKKMSMTARGQALAGRTKKMPGRPGGEEFKGSDEQGRASGLAGRGW